RFTLKRHPFPFNIYRMKTPLVFVIVLISFAPLVAQQDHITKPGKEFAQNGTAFHSLKAIAYQDGKQQLNGLISANAGEALPGVLILPAWKGIDEEAKEAALELEKQGYIAFIADIYGEGNIPSSTEEAAQKSKYYKENYNE